MDNNYWVKIWNDNNIIQQTNPQSQVGRTLKGVPVSLEIWERTLNHLRISLSLKTDDHLLDICAGNGLISSDFSQYVEKITSLDVSERLLLEIKKLNIPNIKIVLGDLRDIEFPENSFSKIVFYFALQHFTENETVRIFLKISRWLKKDGICYIGDIPDIDRKWNFYNTTEREGMYFSMIRNDDLHIGSWFKKDFLLKLANFSGFLSADIFDQEEWMINSKYRFDLVLKK
jgi:cyclopropane fatty-acyl-phospholipid synthase-like methyltransferase